MSARLGIRLLGEFSVSLDGIPIPGEAWRLGRAGSLVKLLALAPHHRLTRDAAIEALWPGVAPEAGGANVRKAVHFARRAVGTESAIGVAGGRIELWPGQPLDIDVDAFEQAGARALAAGSRDAASSVVDGYGGGLLPEDPAEPWADGRRRAVEETYLRLLRAAGRWTEIIRLDPTDEEAHREVIRAHLEAGHRHAAIRQFERLRDILRDELGVGPDPQSVALYERVLDMEGREAPTAAERARALLAWGLIHWNRRDLEEAERTAHEARALAVDAGLGAQVGEASMLLASIGISRGRWRNFLREELLETVRHTPDLAPFVFDSNLCFMEFCLYLPDGSTEMAAFAAELRAAAAAVGSKRALGLAELILGETELLRGHLAEADHALRRAVELHHAAATPSGESLSLARLAEVAIARGQRWKARRLLDRAERLAHGDPLAGHLLVKIQGATIQAAASLADAATEAAEGELLLARGDVCDQCSMSFRVAAADAFAAVDDLLDARRHLDEAARVSEMWQGGPWPVAVEEARARFGERAANRAG